MRRWAFVVFVIGIFVMFILANQLIEEVMDETDLSRLELNARVSLSGKVVGEKIIYDGTKLLELEDGIEVVCESDFSFVDRNVRVIGKVSEYDGKRQVIAEKVLF